MMRMRPYPQKQRYWFFEAMWSMSFGRMLVLLFGAYILLNACFSLAEYGFRIPRLF